MLATKVHGRTHPDANGQGLSRKHIMTEIDASLKRLGTDYIDLYQIHRYDPETPIEETLEALHDVVKSGKRRATSAPPRCMLGSSAVPSTSRTGTAGPASYRCRTTTTCFTARKSARWWRCASPRASA